MSPTEYYIFPSPLFLSFIGQNVMRMAIVRGGLCAAAAAYRRFAGVGAFALLARPRSAHGARGCEEEEVRREPRTFAVAAPRQDEVRQWRCLRPEAAACLSLRCVASLGF